MPCEFEIDEGRGVVLSRAWGAITDAEVLSHQSRLRGDPAFDPGMMQIFDLRDVTDTKGLTSAGVMSLAEGNPFGAGSRRVILTSRKAVYGLARMFQTLTSDLPDELHVVYGETRDAEERLGLPAAGER